MTKPIGYFTSHKPGDGTVFNQLSTQFGAQLEGMGQEEKYCLMAAICDERSQHQSNWRRVAGASAVFQSVTTKLVALDRHRPSVNQF